VPRSGPAWNALGVVCQSQNKLEDADSAFRLVIELNPKALPPCLLLSRGEIKRQA
jgi:Flp pilus assembly protein TadD